jgi:hypothetical protein
MALDMFPIPRRDTFRTGAYRMVPSSSYRSLLQMMTILLILQLLTIAVLVVEVVG